MHIPIEIFRELESKLPSVEDYEASFIRKDFDHDGNQYSIYFYKVRDYGKYFWLCDPTQVHDRIG